MGAPIDWRPADEAIIVTMRGIGYTWDAIATVLKMSRWTVIERGRRLGAKLPPEGRLRPPTPPPPPRPAAPPPSFDARPPLPPGHPTTWGVITRGTCLAGQPYGKEED